jgi:hypothetical protein
MSDRRDRTLEQALKHELRAMTSPATDDCLDAETLAAWSDGGLDASQAAMAEAHVSSCSRCQSLVGTFARGTPAQEPLQAPAARKAFWSWWMAPLAAGAAAVTLWMVVPGQREIAMAPPQPSAPAAATETLRPQAPADAPAPAQPLRDNSSLDASRNTGAAERERGRQQDAIAPKAQEARKETAAGTLAETITVGAAGAAVPPAAPAPAPALAPPTPAAPPLPAARAAESAPADLQRNAQFAFAPLEIVSPSLSQRWRVNVTGVERSLDAGTSWSLVRPAAGETITAGTSPSPGVCWLIGRSGVVLVTADGATFTRADIPGAGDLRSIIATNSSSATVVSTTGRAFRTDDGGRTWR